LRRHWKLILASIILILSTSGCSIGIREKQLIVYCGFAKTAPELKGAIRIAENEKLKVTIEGEEQIATEMHLGGMIAIRTADLTELIKLANERKK